jgi:hypothetical protein
MKRAVCDCRATSVVPLAFHQWCQLSPWSRVLEKIIVTQLVRNFPAIYGTWRFIAMFKRARHWSLSWARCIQSTPTQPVSSVELNMQKTKYGLHIGILFMIIQYDVKSQWIESVSSVVHRDMRWYITSTRLSTCFTCK